MYLVGSQGEEITEENSKKAFLLLDQMEKEGSLSLQSISLTMGDLTNQFLKGKIGIMFNSSMAIDSIREENPDLEYVIPKEGSNVWVDCMVIPKDAKNKENAEKFINFLCRPDIAQKNCEAIWYSSPNTGAIELMGEDYASNPVMNPSDETVANCEYFNDLDATWLTVYNTLWQEVLNTKQGN